MSFEKRNVAMGVLVNLATVLPAVGWIGSWPAAGNAGGEDGPMLWARPVPGVLATARGVAVSLTVNLRRGIATGGRVRNLRAGERGRASGPEGDRPR